MRLYIIGNGFDRGHGLPTAYWDFRTYLDNNYPDFLRTFEEHYSIYPGMSSEEKQGLLWNRFETNLANIDEDEIIESCTGLDLGLESGDTGIEDTLYYYFSNEYDYINKLAKYLKQWVRTIRIRDCLPRTSLIDKKNGDQYITFNFTAVLENVYNIPPGQIIHIHGSLRDYTIDPVLGHGNISRIQAIQDKLSAAEMTFDEKMHSICNVIKDYYQRTFKDTNKYVPELLRIDGNQITEIHVIGHSLDGVDMPYFSEIDNITGNKLPWTIYAHKEADAEEKKARLADAGVNPNRICIIPSSRFYDLSDEQKARQCLAEINCEFQF